MNTELTVAAFSGDFMMARKVSVYREPEFLELIGMIRSSDVGFCNLEGLPGNFKGYPYANFDGAPMSTQSNIVQELKWAGINLVSVANNHAMDSGPENMLSALESLEAAGITYAGAGRDLDWARMPGHLETSKGLVSLVASDSSEQSVTYYQQHTRASKPGGGYPGRPGVNGIRNDKYYSIDSAGWENLQILRQKYMAFFQREENFELNRIKRDDEKEELLFLGNRFVRGEKFGLHWLMNKSDVEANLRQISSSRKLSHWVFASHHSHESLPYPEAGTLPPAHIIKYAHDCIDAGADAYLGHGVHTGQGIEIYKDKPIFYSLATPIYSLNGLKRIPLERYELYELGTSSTPADYFIAKGERLKQTRGEDIFKRWLQTLFAVFSLKESGGNKTLVELKLYPISAYGNGDLRMGDRPKLVKDEELAKKIIDRYARLSTPFGTQIEYSNGIGIVKL